MRSNVLRQSGRSLPVANELPAANPAKVPSWVVGVKRRGMEVLLRSSSCCHPAVIVQGTVDMVVIPLRSMQVMRSVSLG